MLVNGTRPGNDGTGRTITDLLGYRYAINRMTQGIDMSTLREGQRVECTVTVHLPRVLRAKALPTSSAPA